MLVMIAKPMTATFEIVRREIIFQKPVLFIRRSMSTSRVF